MISHHSDSINIENWEVSMGDNNDYSNAAKVPTAGVAVTGSKLEHLVGQVATWYRLILAHYFWKQLKGQSTYAQSIPD